MRPLWLVMGHDRDNVNWQLNIKEWEGNRPVWDVVYAGKGREAHEHNEQEKAERQKTKKREAKLKRKANIAALADKICQTLQEHGKLCKTALGDRGCRSRLFDDAIEKLVWKKKIVQEGKYWRPATAKDGPAPKKKKKRFILRRSKARPAQ